MATPEKILKKYWGYDSFRLGQKEIIESVINGKDVLAILPTGGGKSICFQVPGIALEGIVIVISPLIALMQDQVNQLNSRGIKSIALTSNMSYRELDNALDNARFGGAKFLYISPERLKSKLVFERIKLMTIGLFVVDEAHCISEWGHDFRPAYKDIAQVREFHSNVPMIALTATATSQVKTEIISLLALKKPSLFENTFTRDNLIYTCKESTRKWQEITEWIKRNPNEVGIIYCQSRRNVKEIAKHLIGLGIPATIYHGGMTNKERIIAFNSWMQEQTPIVVATNAFGMGIDKGNVRWVIHMDLPAGPEAYFQEAGRAGRDGKSAQTILLYNEKDKLDLEERISKQFPEIQTIKRIYRAMCSFLQIAVGSGENEIYSFDFMRFIKLFELNTTEVYACLNILEINGDIRFLTDGIKGSRLKITIDNTHLYSFQIRNPELDTLITMMCRMYQQLFEEFVEIDETILAQRLKISESDLQVKLKKLEERGIIDITWRTHIPQIILLHERFSDDYLNIKPESYFFRKERAKDRMNAIFGFLSSTACRQKFINKYFDQESEECGICDNCKKQKKKLEFETKETKGLNFVTINQQELHYSSVLKELLKEGKSLKTIRDFFSIEDERPVLELVKRLMTEGRIIENTDGNLTWK